MKNIFDIIMNSTVMQAVLCVIVGIATGVVFTLAYPLIYEVKL